MNVTRDQAWIEREFGQEKWPLQLKLTEDLIASGERDLARIVSLIQKHHRETQNKANADLAPFETLADGMRVRVPKIMALEGYRAWITHNVLAACRPETDLVIELGSGVGHGLFRLWLAGGPRDARYISCEFTESGRDCAERLASVEPGINLTALPFDFLNPDYSALPRNPRHTVVFTVQAIEQIPQLPEEVFTRLIDTVGPITCVHVEPVGWQLTPDGEPMDDISAAARAYGEKNDYSRNLWSLLTALEARGTIKIEEAVPNIYGVRPLNPQTLVRWRTE